MYNHPNIQMTWESRNVIPSIKNIHGHIVPIDIVITIANKVSYHMLTWLGHPIGVSNGLESFQFSIGNAIKEAIGLMVGQWKLMVDHSGEYFYNGSLHFCHEIFVASIVEGRPFIFIESEWYLL